MQMLGLYVQKEVLNWVIDLHKAIPLVFCFSLTIKFTRPWKRVCVSIRMMTDLNPFPAQIVPAGYLVISL